MQWFPPPKANLIQSDFRPEFFSLTFQVSSFEKDIICIFIYLVVMNFFFFFFFSLFHIPHILLVRLLFLELLSSLLRLSTALQRFNSWNMGYSKTGSYRNCNVKLWAIATARLFNIDTCMNSIFRVIYPIKSHMSLQKVKSNLAPSWKYSDTEINNNMNRCYCWDEIQNGS